MGGSSHLGAGAGLCRCGIPEVAERVPLGGGARGSKGPQLDGRRLGEGGRGGETERRQQPAHNAVVSRTTTAAVAFARGCRLGVGGVWAGAGVHVAHQAHALASLCLQGASRGSVRVEVGMWVDGASGHKVCIYM